MERIRPGESMPRFDFLNENDVVSFEIVPEALEHLPIISAEDKLSGKERFRILLGSASILDASHAHLKISGVLEMEQGDDYLYGLYTEGIEQVTYDPQKIRSSVQSIQRLPQYRSFNHLGEIHTHPKSLLAYPSQVDLEGFVSQYEHSTAEPHKPYIFGIAGIHKSGEVECNFYRIVRVGKGYGFKLLDGDER